MDGERNGFGSDLDSQAQMGRGRLDFPRECILTERFKPAK
jgi:hypothetical protein